MKMEIVIGFSSINNVKGKPGKLKCQKIGQKGEKNNCKQPQSIERSFYTPWLLHSSPLFSSNKAQKLIFMNLLYELTHSNCHINLL